MDKTASSDQPDIVLETRNLRRVVDQNKVIINDISLALVGSEHMGERSRLPERDRPCYT